MNKEMKDGAKPPLEVILTDDELLDVYASVESISTTGIDYVRAGAKAAIVKALAWVDAVKSSQNEGRKQVIREILELEYSQDIEFTSWTRKGGLARQSFLKEIE